jgi:hypothetical protein
MQNIKGFPIQDIIDSHCCGCGWQYLIQWVSYGPEHDYWLTSSALEDCKALNAWLDKEGSGKATW